MSLPRAFVAFAVKGMPPPEGSAASFLTGRVRVSHPTIDVAWLDTLTDGLRRAGPGLARRPAREVAQTLGAVGARFLDPADPLRGEALEVLPSTSGLSPKMAEAVLDGMAADWTFERLEAAVRAELGGFDALDGFHRSGPRESIAVGPRLCVQIVAGSVPGVGVNALLRSLLAKGPTLLKPGRGDVALPVLFARALAESDPALASALAVLYWPGGTDSLEQAAVEAADVVTVYGSDATVRELRELTPVATRFVPYHHRVSVGVVGREALEADRLRETADAAARAVAMFDQRGCVSPQVIYVESRGDRAPADFGHALADALDGLERTLPPGPLDSPNASALHQARGTAEMLVAVQGGKVSYRPAGAWTVLVEPDAGLSALPPVAGRFIRVRPVGDVAEVGAHVTPFASRLQTIGVAGLDHRFEAFARAMAALGATRIVPMDAVPFPPPWWHHDGEGALSALVRWVDVERP